MHQELEREATLKAKVVKSSRRVRALVTISVAMFLFLGLSVAANFLVVYFVVDGQIKTSTTSTGVLSSKDSGEVVKTGQVGVQAGPLPTAQRRKLKTVGHRRLVQVATVASSQVQAIAQSNELNFMVSAQEPEPDPITAEVKTVHLQATSTSSSFNPALSVTNYDVSLGPPGTNLTLLVSCAPDAVDCSVLDADPTTAVRMRELTQNEKSSMRRRLSVRTASTKPTLGKPLDALSAAPPSLVPILGGMETHEGMEPHEPGCVLYHCFAREPDCEEPAPDSECLRWSADGTSCEAPLCRYMDDELLMLDQQMLTEGRRLSGAGATAVFSIIATQTFLLAGSRRSLRNWCSVVEQATMSLIFASAFGYTMTMDQALARATPENPKRNVNFDCDPEFNGEYTAQAHGYWTGSTAPEHFEHANGKWHMYYCNSDGDDATTRISYRRWVVSSAPPADGATTKDNSCKDTSTMRAYWWSDDATAFSNGVFTSTHDEQWMVRCASGWKTTKSTITKI